MGKEKDMHLKARLKRSFVFIGIIASISGVVGAIAILVMSSYYERSMKYYGFSQGDVGKTMAAFADARASLRGAIGYDDEEFIATLVEDYNAKKKEFEENLAAVKAVAVTEKGIELYSKAESLSDEYWKLSDEIVNLGATSDPARSMQAQRRAIDEIPVKYDELYSALEEFMNLNVDLGNDVSELMSVIKIAVCIGVLAVVAVAMFFATKSGDTIATGIAVPMNALGERLKTFAQGDLDSQFPDYNVDDEIRDMIVETRQMADTLNIIITDAGQLLGQMAEGNFNINTKVEDKYVGKFATLVESMRKMNRMMNETLQNVMASSNMVMAGSENLAESSQDLATGATEQASAVQQLQATIATITDASEKSSENLLEAYNVAQKYADEADKSRVQMEAMMEAMQRINETSQQIENIISDIEDIAGQTNLLSLNAAIEAARAGEAGKGFAVVAEQIGNLADQSAKSAVDTRKLIESSLKEIESGNSAAESVSVTISDVVEGIKEVAHTAKELSENSKYQAQAMKEAENGVVQISEVVQSNSAASEECSATSEELSAQAEALNQLVDSFTLRS